MKSVLDVVLHLDKHLADIIGRYGGLTYVILFAIVFCETGLVIAPFLPGDSLLFAAGTFAAIGSLNVWMLGGLLIVAAILGDTVNYWFGKKIGPRAFGGQVKFLKQEHLRATEEFYEKHGKKTIILARFVPIIRTFAPFVAGIGSMRYSVFLAYNVVGGVVWVALLVGAGYFFGNMPIVRKNFSLVVIAIIVISTIPVVLEYLKARRRPRPAVPHVPHVDD